MYTCMCNWVTWRYNRKGTQRCKPAIMEKIKITINKEINLKKKRLKNQKKVEMIIKMVKY